MRSVILGLVVLAAWGADTAQAVPATPEEAQRLTALFERYVGAPAAGKPSAVKIVPHGESYTATLDVTRMLSFVSTMGFDVTAGDFVAELVPQADGQWHVTVDGFPPLGLSQGEQAMSFSISNYKFDGVFDPRIQAFASTSTTTRGSNTHFRGKQAPVDIKLTDNGAGTTKADDAGAGTINVTTTGAYKDIDYRIDSAPTAGKEPAEIGHLRAGSLAAAVTLEHEPIVALNDLWQFLVAHPSKAELIPVQAELKTRLKSIIPLANTVTGSLVLSKVAVDTSLGPFGLDEFSEHSAANGPNMPGNNATTLTYRGLTLPDGLVPVWAAALVPTTLDLTQSYGPLNATPALLMAIDDLDLAAPKPLTDAQQAAILQAMSPDDMTLTVAPSSIGTATLMLKFEGEATFKKPLPTGSATVTATGLDKTIEAVRSAAPNDPSGVQAITLLMAAKALAKAEGPDSYSWHVVAAPGGDVTINGNALSSMAPSQPVKPKTRKKKLEP